MPDFDLDQFMPYRLAVLASRVSQGFARRYRSRFGLSVAEWRVMAHLAQADAVSVGEICRKVDMEKSKVSRAASRLETRGLVSKTANAADKRLVDLSLTEAGHRMMAELAPLAARYQADMLALLSPGDRDAMDRIVAELTEKLK